MRAGLSGLYLLSGGETQVSKQAGEAVGGKESHFFALPFKSGKQLMQNERRDGVCKKLRSVPTTKVRLSDIIIFIHISVLIWTEKKPYQFFPISVKTLHFFLP